MAQILTGPTIAQQRAQQIGSPILNTIQRLSNMQMENVQKQKERSNVLAGLSTMMPMEEANALSHLPKSMISAIMRNKEVEKRQQAQQQKQQQKQEEESFKTPTRINSLIGLKKELAKKMISDPKEVEFELQNAQMSQVERKLLMSNELDNEIIDYLLSVYEGDPEKARKAAKKLGFKGI